MQGGGEEEVSIEELACSLSTYKQQLQQVRRILVDDPGNSEYEDMEKELAEVIALTEELLETARQSQKSGLTSIVSVADVSPGLHLPKGTSQQYLDSDTMSDQSDKLRVGTKVQAVWSEDGEWYDAIIEVVTPNGYYVSCKGWGNKEEGTDYYYYFRVDPANIRLLQEGGVDTLLEAEKEAEATKLALK